MSQSLQNCCCNDLSNLQHSPKASSKFDHRTPTDWDFWEQIRLNPLFFFSCLWIWDHIFTQNSSEQITLHQQYTPVDYIKTSFPLPAIYQNTFCIRSKVTPFTNCMHNDVISPDATSTHIHNSSKRNVRTSIHQWAISVLSRWTCFQTYLGITDRSVPN